MRRSQQGREGAGRGLLLALALTVAAVPATAQQVIEVTQEIDFERPEAWTLAYFTQATSLAAGPPADLAPGEVELSLELGWLPDLDEEQRTVGFTGTKEEDLNQISVVARPRLTVGLPARFSLTVGWVPPVEVNDVEGNVATLALARPLVDGVRWGLGARLAGQVGDVTGAFTCPEDLLGVPPGPDNPFGCDGLSDDRAELAYGSVELTGWRRFGDARESAAFLTARLSELDVGFQVDAPLVGARDRTKLESDGSAVAFEGGASFALGAGVSFDATVLWAPLDIERPRTGEESDDLVTGRVVLGYRLGGRR